MIFTVAVRTEAFLARMRGAPQKLRIALVRAVTKLSILVQRGVKEDKLTGQVLHVRTGTLRRSINREVVEREDGVFAVIGTNVEYARPHEYGFSGVVSVRAYVRKLMSGGTTSVREHARRVNLPERSFLRSTLRDYQTHIRDDLRAAALGVLK